MENTRNTKRNLIVIASIVVVILLIAGAFGLFGNIAGAQEISKEDAAQVALNHANANDADVDRIKTVKDVDDGIVEYDVDFVYNGYEYEYTIDGRTGEILEASKERVGFDSLNNGADSNNGTTVDNNAAINNTSNNGSTANNSGSANNYIGEEKAKNIAVKDSGAANPEFVRVELDTDDGVTYYDVEFREGNMEYDYEINASTGAIIKKDKEIDND